MRKGYMYILECADGSYYTGSTKFLWKRLGQHYEGKGEEANYTMKRLPVKLVYFEKFDTVAEAFYREKQIRGWSRAKKEAIINGSEHLMRGLSECQNESHFKHFLEDVDARRET